MGERFTEEEIARVKAEADLVAVVSGLVPGPVKRSGQGRFVTSCPFHTESTPSFTLYPGEARCHCFGCGWDGDVVAFVEGVKGLDFPGAMKFLGGRPVVSDEGDGGGKKPVKRKRKGSGGKKVGNAGADARGRTSLPKKEGEKPRRDLGGEADPAVEPPLRSGQSVVKVYDYCRADGSVAHQKVRLSPKAFLQRRPLGVNERTEWEARRSREPGWEPPFERDGWVYSLAGVLLFPYRLGEVLSAKVSDPVFFCEGEKDADTIVSLGLVATTFTDKNFLPEYGPFFEGRWIVVVEDFDGLDPQTGKRPGEVHARRLGEEFVRYGAGRVTWVRMGELWNGCDEGVDVSDWVGACRSGLVPDASIRDDLLACAERGLPPMEVLYAGYFLTGERGGVRLVEDVVADGIVNHRRLLAAGGDFWQWRLPGEGEAGTWRPVGVGAQVHGWIREVLRMEEVTRPLIDSRTLNSVVNVMGSTRFVHPDELNGHDGFLLNCRSGMLDVRSGELLRHEERYLSTTQVPVVWDANARCDRWLEVLERLQPDGEVRDLIQEMFGYCLVPGVNYHKFFFLYGDGGTGKSTVAEMLTALVGERNTMALQLEELDNAFMRSQLVGKQLFLAGELTSRSFKHIGLLKQMVAGEPIFVDVKNRAGFTYRPRGRFVMTSNVVASTPDTSGGFERRFLQIDFKHVIPEEEKNYELMGELRRELPGVFRWAVEGFRRLYDRGRFVHTRASEEATRELMRHRASVKEFLNDGEWVSYLEPARAGREDVISAEDLFKHYNLWCEFYGVNPYYKEKETFSKEAYRRREDMRSRQVRRMIDNERQVGFVGVVKCWPEGWEPGQL